VAQFRRSISAARARSPRGRPGLLPTALASRRAVAARRRILEAAWDAARLVPAESAVGAPGRRRSRFRAEVRAGKPPSRTGLVGAPAGAHQARDRADRRR